MNFKNEIPPKSESNELSPQQKENFDHLLHTLVLAEKNTGQSILNVKNEFLKILPEFIDKNELEKLEKIYDKKELLKKYIEQISSTKVGWGFTPKLALEKEEGVHGFDCTGATITLGAICEKYNIPMEVGIEINHAIIIADIDGEKYYADARNNNFFKIKTTPEKFEHYELYKLSENEKNKTALNYSLIATSTLDEFIGDAILGNIIELKNLSLEKESDIPSGDQGAKIIAQKYKKDLIKDDWDIIHNKLYPHVEDYLKDSKELWKNEEIRVKTFMEENYLKKVLDNVILETEKSLGHSKEDLENIYPQIISELKGKILEVINFLKGSEIPDSLSQLSEKYIKELKKNILNLDNKEKNYIIESIENRLTN